MKLKILLGIIAVFIIIQFFRIDKTAPESDPKDDIIVVESVPTEIAILLKTSCYDCHSNVTRYPWYSNVAPVSWWLKKHINEGRDELNFSDWGNYSERRRGHKLKETIELVKGEEMPLPSYLWVHGEARLSDKQRKQLMNWAKALRKGEVVEEK